MRPHRHLGDFETCHYLHPWQGDRWDLLSKSKFSQRITTSCRLLTVLPDGELLRPYSAFCPSVPKRAHGQRFRGMRLPRSGTSNRYCLRFTHTYTANESGRVTESSTMMKPVARYEHLTNAALHVEQQPSNQVVKQHHLASRSGSYAQLFSPRVETGSRLPGSCRLSIGIICPASLTLRSSLRTQREERPAFMKRRVSRPSHLHWQQVKPMPQVLDTGQGHP